MKLPNISVALLAVPLFACDGGGGAGSTYINELPPGQFSTAAQVENFVAVSAPAVYFIAGASGGVGTYTDPRCPQVTVNGNSVSVTGGCTDATGVMWRGSMTGTNVVMPTTTTPATGTFTYMGFGSSTPALCGGETITSTSTLDGTVTATPSGATTSFTTDVRLTSNGPTSSSNCTVTMQTTGIAYAGSFARRSDGTSTWNGTGRVGNSRNGVVTATTVAEVRNDLICQTESLAGTTTIEAAGNTAVITYDGATNCDPSATATWTYNGASMGVLTGVSCGVARVPGRLSALWAMWGAFAIGVLARRRSRSTGRA